jgi:hypothetical protein
MLASASNSGRNALRIQDDSRASPGDDPSVQYRCWKCHAGGREFESRRPRHSLTQRIPVTRRFPEYSRVNFGNSASKLAGAGVPQVLDWSWIRFHNYAITQVEGAA